jgi:hypothetical protein
VDVRFNAYNKNPDNNTRTECWNGGTSREEWANPCPENQNEQVVPLCKHTQKSFSGLW